MGYRGRQHSNLQTPILLADRLHETASVAGVSAAR